MSHANISNEVLSDADKCSVNDNEQTNNTISGAPETSQTLQDHTIEEKEKPDCDTDNTKNDEDSNNSNPLNTSYLNQLKEHSMAIYYGWQFVCLLIFMFTAYETLQTVLPKAEKYPEPQRFFSIESFVRDHPRGDLGLLQSKVALSDLSFVMFYAPWSADSQYARPVLETISKIFYREADFFAINCWQPDGECRHQYKKVMSWPVLMAYTKNNIAIPYNGQWTETALARFVYLTMKPIHRISKPEDLLAILHNHDAVVTLFVNMQTSHTFHKIFYQAAIKWLEKDPQGDVAFAVVTGESMNSFGVDSEPTLRLYLWNRTMEYEDDVWKASLIHKWIIRNKQQISHWISPPGSRSKLFDIFVQRGPVLLLFTPRNLYDFPSDAYAMVRQIAYEYNNCGDDGWLKEMGRNYIYDQRKTNIRNYLLQSKDCEKILNWRNSVSDKCIPFDRNTLIGLSNSSKFLYNTVRSKQKAEYCENVPQQYETTFTLSGYVTSIVDTKNDLRSSENILNEWQDIHCKMINLSKKLRPRIFQDPALEKASNVSEINFHKITGFGCKTNKSLSFLALDSLNYGLVAEKLGISLKRAPQSSVAVIIDSEDESSYVLKESLTTPNLIEFVYNYTTNKLSRHLRHDGNAKHSHFYNAGNSHGSENYHPNIDKENPTRKIEPINISVISSENFTEFVSDPHRTVAVLFTSSQCAFCTIFSSILLTLARILNDADYLKIARIDSDKNDLPWQYTMETLPAFIIFNNKLESRKYPTTMKVTMPNVMGFVLSNLSHLNRMRALASIIKYRQKQKQPIETTVIILRRETEINIVDSLRAWRSNFRKRNYILRRIQALRRLYFALHSQTTNQNLNELDELIKEVQFAWLHDTSVHQVR